MQQFEKEYTNKLPKKQFRRLNTKVTVQLNTSIAIEPHCLAVTVEHTVSSKSCHGAWTSAPLSAHPSIECKRTAPQIETHICTCRTTAQQFI